MYLTNLRADPSKLSLLRTAIDNLKSINFFAVMYELASSKVPIGYALKEQTLEQYAFRSSFNDGYLEAMHDLESFFEMYMQESKPKGQLKADFGGDKVREELKKELV